MFHHWFFKRNNAISSPSPSKSREDTSNNDHSKDDDPKCKIQFRTTAVLALRLSAKRILFFYLFFISGMYIAHIIFIEKSGITEFDLLNELLDKSKDVYENSNFKSSSGGNSGSSSIRQTRNPTTRPGYKLRQEEGAKAKYPVVMVPGFITSGLELWDGEECARGYFRQRIWGSLPVFVQSFFSDYECWHRHLSLDPKTGLDPQNIRLRSAQGFEATDYVMSTFWVWEKMIENLADVGYDPSNMIMMPYDWRLSFIALEKRDGYLTKLKYSIEAMVKSSGQKVVLTSHSMGSQIIFFFFKWVTTKVSEGGGGGGKDWVEFHIHAFVNIAGPMLGVPKAVTALLSGEMKDTAAIMGTMGGMVERIFGRNHRKELWQTWGSLWNMLPLGGDAIWGQAGDIIDYSSCNEHLCAESESGTSASQPLLTFDSAGSDKVEWSVIDSLRYLKYDAEGQENSRFIATEVNDSTLLHKQQIEHWHDPISTPLPFAPSMTIYCLYGVGIETERAYFYKRSSSRRSLGLNGLRDDESTFQDKDMLFVMDTSVNEPLSNIRFGVQVSDGDASVPLVSLGYMCVDGWKENKRLNPSNLKVVTREYVHQETFWVNDPMRKGPLSADHVDILGNIDTTADLLKIVTDLSTATLQDNIIHSNIVEVSSRVSSRTNLKSKKKTYEDFFLDLEWGIE